MFVGLGKEKHTYTTPQLRNLFVGLPKRNNKEERYFRYLGVYRVSRVEPLSVDEWKSLDSSVSPMLCSDFTLAHALPVGQTELCPHD